MNESEKVTGGCLCGSIRYEAEVYLQDAFYCHCRMCQKSSGAPAEVGIFVRPETLRFTSGEPIYYQSSPTGRRGFCSDCGSRLVWMSPENPEDTNIAVGCLDHPEKVVPAKHTYVGSQLPWYNVEDDLPRHVED